jgi:hypothetical protein
MSHIVRNRRLDPTYTGEGRRLVSRLSLCLSRACLGKKISFSKTIALQKKRFSRTNGRVATDSGRREIRHVVNVEVVERVDALAAARCHPCEKRHSFFECCPYVCPEPVLVKWYILYINGAKSGVSHLNHRRVSTAPTAATTG